MQQSIDRDITSITSKYKRSGVASDYSGIRDQEQRFRGEMQRTIEDQDHRLSNEIQKNSDFRRDIRDLKDSIATRMSPERNYDRELVRRKQNLRENELLNRRQDSYSNNYIQEQIKRRHYEQDQALKNSSTFEPLSHRGAGSPNRVRSPNRGAGSPNRAGSPSRLEAHGIKIDQVRREEEIYDRLYSPKDRQYESRLKDSLKSNRTFDLSQSVKESTYHPHPQEKIASGLKTLETKIDRMERDLDRQLGKNERHAYHTNQELVKQSQRTREAEIMRDQLDRDYQIRTQSAVRTTNGNQFEKAFSKREQKLKDDSRSMVRSPQRRSQSAKKNRYRSYESTPNKSEHNQSRYDSEANLDESRVMKSRYESELEKLQQENVRIKQQLTELKKKENVDKLYGKNLPIESYRRKSDQPPDRPKQREQRTFSSSKAFASMVDEDDIKSTAAKARKRMHEKLTTNKKERSQSAKKSRKVDYGLTKYQNVNKSAYKSLKKETYKQYYGNAPHFAETAYLLNKGMPTTLTSDTNVQSRLRDPKKTMPKKFERVFRY